MKGKITVELEYEDTLDGITLTHPDLEGALSFKASSERLIQIQLDALNITKPKTPIEEIVADGQELIEAARGLRQLVPEILAAIKGKA